jgi:hypothetical protein
MRPPSCGATARARSSITKAGVRTTTNGSPPTACGQGVKYTLAPSETRRGEKSTRHSLSSSNEERGGVPEFPGRRGEDARLLPHAEKPLATWSSRRTGNSRCQLFGQAICAPARRQALFPAPPLTLWRVLIARGCQDGAQHPGRAPLKATFGVNRLLQNRPISELLLLSCCFIILLVVLSLAHPSLGCLAALFNRVLLPTGCVELALSFFIQLSNSI